MKREEWRGKEVCTFLIAIRDRTKNCVREAMKKITRSIFFKRGEVLVPIPRRREKHPCLRDRKRVGKGLLYGTGRKKKDGTKFLRSQRRKGGKCANISTGGRS